jgi:predicted ATP-grasp superfamily ATP-dependent carboligase
VVVAPPVAHSAQGFVEAVAELCTAERNVLIPGTEVDLVALVEGQHLLPPSVLGLPCPDTLHRVTDKLALTASATSAGFSAPPTSVVRAGAFETDTAFPYIVKPLHTVIRKGDTLASLSAVAIESPRQLVKFKRQLGATEAVVQPLLGGRLNALAGVMWQGRLLAPMQQVALSVFPKPCGGSAVARTVPVDPTVCERAERLMNELGCEGIVQLQWLEDDEKQYVIDLNPRVYGSLALANAAGSELAVVWTKLLLGQELDAAPAPRDVLYRNLETFLRAGGRHALFPARAADGTANSVFALDDPLPVLGSVARVAKKMRRDLRGAASSRIHGKTQLERMH